MNKKEKISQIIDKTFEEFWNNNYMPPFRTEIESLSLFGVSIKNMKSFLKERIKEQIEDRIKVRNELDEFTLTSLIQHHFYILSLFLYYHEDDKRKLEDILKEYAKKNCNNGKELEKLSSTTLSEPTKSKPGRKPGFNNETELHDAIKKINDWENKSKEKISVELGRSKSWLRLLLNEKNWSFPLKAKP